MSSAEVDFVSMCLSFDPEQRPSADQLLQHSYLTEVNKDVISFFGYDEVQPAQLEGAECETVSTLLKPLSIEEEEKVQEQITEEDYGLLSSDLSSRGSRIEEKL